MGKFYFFLWNEGVLYLKEQRIYVKVQWMSLDWMKSCLNWLKVIEFRCRLAWSGYLELQDSVATSIIQFDL